MTDHHQPGWTEVHALSGAYAVDALDDLERARFEAHLRECAECQAEVDSLREAAASLALDAVEPPEQLRAEVLAGIETIRPLRAGEELTYDYNTEGDKTIPCRCRPGCKTKL